MVIGIDFDNTIVYEKFPEIGELKPNVQSVINYLYNRGHKIIIWSCREGVCKYEAINFLLNNRILFDSFNENLPERIKLYNNDPRKLGYDVLIDDRNLGGIPDDWNDILTLLIKQFGDKI